MIARFLDIDTILTVNSQPWIVSKHQPNNPIMKISQSDFNLMRNGIYKSHGNRLEFNGKSFWLPNDLMNRLKVKAKISKVDISNLAISMQEFLNKEIISDLDFEINKNVISTIKNTQDSIYIICSRNSKDKYEKMIQKVESKLGEFNINIKNYYYISETFFNRDHDDISYKKVRLLLQHLIGYKTEINKFTEEHITKYDEIYYYDDEVHSINLAKDINSVFQSLLSNTDPSIKSSIKDSIKSKDNILVINQVTSNENNPFITTKIMVEYSNLIKAFENFRNF